MLPDPVIVVPGITASNLRDEYPVKPEPVWSALLNKAYERLALHPDNLRYETLEPARVRVDSIFELPYRELIEQLRYELSPSPNKPVPVYPFMYDWRHPLAVTEEALAYYVEEVIERTLLMRHYVEDGYEERMRVNLVGHSMGGLIIAGYMKRAEASDYVHKVVSIGSPFRGAVEAPVKVVTGTAELGTGPSSSREREAARVTPALYHLLPDKKSGMVGDKNGKAVDLYNPNNWQPSIFETLALYVKLYSSQKVTVGESKVRAEALLGEILKGAAAYRKRTESLTLPDEADWLCIVGIDSKTRTRLEVHSSGGKPTFDLDSAEPRNEWGKPDSSDWTDTGDGTVPYWGARAKFISKEKVVCVRPDDFAFGEFGDQALYRTIGFHGTLPKMNLVHRLIVSHVTGELQRNTWGHVSPELKKGEKAVPPIKGLEMRSGK